MIRVIAPAKINFFLEITGKRPDGYHTLSILFQTISLGDELTFEAAKDISLTCSDPTLPTDESNLVMKAALRLRAALGESQGVKMHLKKIVPMGAGLGGGSSDAAAVLQSLCKVWKREVPPAQLAEIAVSLGADVPFFLKGGLCSATGIGEILTPLPAIAETWLVLVYPGFGVPTKGAYGRARLPFSDPRTLDLKPMTTPLFNRFESLVFPDHPQLPQLKEDLLKAGAIASLMSGSGSAVFGLAKSKIQGEQILSTIKAVYPQSWLVHTT